MKLYYYNMKKILLKALLLLTLLLGLLTACTEPEPGKDAVLVVEQYVNLENGMTYVTSTMTWEQGKVGFRCVFLKPLIRRITQQRLI